MSENTKIFYLYRDADNYKVHNEVIVKGKLDHNDIVYICSTLSEGEYFIPSQVGLPEKRFEEWTDSDHCWFELDEDCFEWTNDDPTINMTAEELLNNFAAAYRSGWDDTKIPSASVR